MLASIAENTWSHAKVGLGQTLFDNHFINLESEPIEVEEEPEEEFCNIFPDDVTCSGETSSSQDMETSEPYEDGRNDYTENYDWYNKGHVHTIIWTSAWNVAVPMIYYSEFYKKAESDMTESGSKKNPEDFSTTVMAWKKIMYAQAALWGPMVLIGAFALSDIFRY